MDLMKALRISADGMEAQSTRLRIVAENIANRDSTPATPGAEPYRRKTVSFRAEFDRSLGAETVAVRGVGRDPSAFPRRLEPGHPAADAQGYVQTPNVNSLIEVMDMREAQRSYGANLAVLEVTRGMLQRAIDILR
ncbi:MAG: flagellar basal body rod protein FlgC [Alphaproteobacteria bacterium]|nr:flagellar basal body rod protein FlgC [Alphaproteobacteria bacterium]